MKILAPAGNFDCLKVAVINGADEVYIGVNEFNARNNIDGFTMDNLEKAVDFAHFFGVKINLAINILFTDEELNSALDIVVDAYNMGVDSFIVQDLALASILHKNYPEIELHASTQMGIHNLEGVKEIEKFGFKRVVLARETPLSEIKRIKENSNIEIEYFAHGALCVCFSGNCYLSSYMFNASGNRGRCKQLCRLPYILKKGGKVYKKGYLLSAKDFDMIERLDDLKNSGVSVLKIEGRARRPFYVATAVKSYKSALNSEKIDKNQLKLAFNRGFTQGYFNGNGQIISNRQNHEGILIGKVTKFIKGKNFNQIFIKSDNVINKKSVLKFLTNDSEVVLSAFDVKNNNGLYQVTTKQKVEIGAKVHLISDMLLEDAVLNVVNKKDLKINLEIVENSPIKATIDVDEINCVITGELCEKAVNQPLTNDDFIKCFNKSDLFNAKIEFSKFSNVFLTKQNLNQFRRKVFDTVYTNLINKHKKNTSKMILEVKKKDYLLKDYQIIDNLAHTFSAKNIIYSPEEYNINEVEYFVNICKEKGVNGYIDTPNFALESDINQLEEIINKTKIGVVANNYYALSLSDNIIIGAGLNVYNSLTAKIYDKPIIVAESNDFGKINFAYMTLRHCPIKSHLNCDCKSCKFSNDITYEFENGKSMKLKRKKLSTCTFYLTE